MIETKEQYEETLLTVNQWIGKPYRKALRETIEALRRFVRASDAIEDATISFELHRAQVEELRASRKALPKWIAEGRSNE